MPRKTPIVARTTPLLGAGSNGIRVIEGGIVFSRVTLAYHRFHLSPSAIAEGDEVVRNVPILIKSSGGKPGESQFRAASQSRHVLRLRRRNAFGRAIRDDARLPAQRTRASGDMDDGRKDVRSVANEVGGVPHPVSLVHVYVVVLEESAFNEDTASVVSDGAIARAMLWDRLRDLSLTADAHEGLHGRRGRVC